MAESVDELILKHTATGRESGVHEFQGLYVKSVDEKGETHYTKVDYLSLDHPDVGIGYDGAVILPEDTLGIIVKR